MGAVASIFTRPSCYDMLPQTDPTCAALPAFLSGNRLGLNTATGERVALVLRTQGLEVVYEETSSPKTRKQGPHNGVIPFLQILSATVTDSGFLSLAALYERVAGAGPLFLWRLEADVSAVAVEQLAGWIQELLDKAYQGQGYPQITSMINGLISIWLITGVKPNRRFLVLVNPHGGRGKAQQIWDNIVEPIFNAAGSQAVLLHTGPSNTPTNARTLAQNLDLQLYDALVPISGDGITSELLNGLATRSDALLALQTPISPIPGGSGNALSVNIMGPVRVLDPGFAALNAIKARVMSIKGSWCGLDRVDLNA
ncbi:hypothetical protein P7C70_g3029, partial [Phenoliferia sp. Uapishka_3]